jgi:4-aminobutyrate aminotransferase
MTLAKGLGSGLPIGMVVAKRSIMQKWTRGAHGNTFGGNPVCCAAALATLDLVEREYCANAAKVGELLHEALHALAHKYPVIGEVRGKGLMIGMELVLDPSSKAPAKKLCDALITRAFHNGLIFGLRPEHGALHAAAHDRRGDVDEAIELLSQSLDEVLADQRPAGRSRGRRGLIEPRVSRSIVPYRISSARRAADRAEVR